MVVDNEAQEDQHASENGAIEMNGYSGGANNGGPAVIDVSPTEQHDSISDVRPPTYDDAATAVKYAPEDGGGGKPNSEAAAKEDGEKKKEKGKEGYERTVGMFEVFRFATGLDILLILLATFVSLCHGVALPAVLLLFGEVTDAFITTDRDSANSTDAIASFNAAIDNIETFATYYAYLGVAVLVLAYCQVALWDLSAERQIHQVRLRFFHSILRQEVAWFDIHKGGELNTRLADDISKIRMGIGDKLGVMLQYTATFISGIIIGFVKSWALTLIILLVSLILVVPTVGTTAMFIQKMTKKVLDAYAKAGAIADEVLSGIRTVVAFGGEEEEVGRYAQNLVEAKDESIKKDTFTLLSQGFLFFAIYCSYAIAFWAGTVFYIRGQISPGDILTTFLSVLFGAFAVGQAGPSFGDFTTARGAAAVIWEVIDTIPTIDCFSTEGKKPEKVNGQVTFEGVHFSYPSRSEVKVLNGLNLKVNVGQTVALVGSSGCGKSTCIQLIQRFYDVSKGNVQIDGIDIRDFNVSWLRDHIGVVSQEPVLFATTIGENIRYGRLDVTQEEIEKAAMEANAHSFISNLPEGYNTLVGERGAQLSGGQKQRIAIARALVRNPTILLLDEATSALDTESEGIVQAALEKAQAGRTTIVIAHRLSTIVNSDVICAFKDGVVVEQGRHEELMKMEGGVYHTLVMKQSRKSEEETKKDVALDEEEEEENGHEEKVYREGSVKKGGLKRMLSRTQSQISGDSNKKEEEEEEAALEKHFSWGRIWRLNTPECGFIFLGCLGAAINGGIQPGFAIIFSNVLGAFGLPTNGEIFAEITKYCIAFAGLGVAALLGSIIQGVGFAKSGGELTLRLRHMMFKAMLRQNIGWFDDKSHATGALTTKLATEVSLIQGVTGIRIGMIFEVICNIGVGIAISFYYCWQLACLLLFGFLPLLSLAGMLGWRILQGNSISQQGSQVEVGKLVSEAIENIRTVQSLNRGQLFHEKYTELQKPPYKQGLRGAFAAGLAFGFSQAMIFFAYAAVFRLGAYLVENIATTGVSFTDVFLSFSAIMFGAFGLGRAMGSVPDFSKAKVATAELFQLVDREPEIDSYNEDGEKPASYSGSVSFSGVRFRYPTRPDVPVLRGLSVEVNTGETLALVGSSGCGKSTTIQLIERFYDPRMGCVNFDTHDTTLLNIRWLRSQLGLVSQEPVLFDRSIAENIMYGDNSRTVTIEECIAAAKKANIHDFVDSLPMKYETNVGAKGTQLSGGQKQRIAIARALVRNPKVLLLDEATSALDTESERVVQDALDEAKKGRTCITIAHRLSTIHNAEKIAVIREGRLAEFGKHEELMAQKGQYYTLYMAQQLQH